MRNVVFEWFNLFYKEVYINSMYFLQAHEKCC